MCVESFVFDVFRRNGFSELGRVGFDESDRLGQLTGPTPCLGLIEVCFSSNRIVLHQLYVICGWIPDFAIFEDNFFFGIVVI